MNRITFQKALWKCGYNTLNNRGDGEKLLEKNDVVTKPVTIFLKNSYQVHLREEYHPELYFWDEVAEIITKVNGNVYHIIFDVDEVASIQVKNGNC